MMHYNLIESAIKDAQIAIDYGLFFRYNILRKISPKRENTLFRERVRFYLWER